VNWLFYSAVWKRVQVLPHFIGCMCLSPDPSLSCLFKLMLKGSCSATDQIIQAFVESVTIQMFQLRANQKSYVQIYKQENMFVDFFCNATFVQCIGIQSAFSFDFPISERCLVSTLFCRVDRLSYLKECSKFCCGTAKDTYHQLPPFPLHMVWIKLVASFAFQLVCLFDPYCHKSTS